MNKKFANDLKVGEIGEQVVVNYLQKEEHVIQIIDVRDDKKFQVDDIDYLVYTDNFIIFPIEVKTDTMAHRTGNIAYEVYSNKHYRTKGCLEKTKAKFVYYYLTETKTLYNINVQKLREYVHNNYDESQLRNMGDYALGYLIKIKELVNKNIMKEIGDSE